MSSSVPPAERALDDSSPEMIAGYVHAWSANVADPITYRSPGRFSHRHGIQDLPHHQATMAMPLPLYSPEPSVPRSLPSLPSPHSLQSQFPSFSSYDVTQPPVVTLSPNPNLVHLTHDAPDDSTHGDVGPVSKYTEYDGWSSKVHLPGSGVEFPSANLFLDTAQPPVLNTHVYHTQSPSNLINGSPEAAASVHQNIDTTINPLSPSPSIILPAHSRGQCAGDYERVGASLRGEECVMLGCLPGEDAELERSDLSTTDGEDGIGISIHLSSKSSSSSASTSHRTMFVSFPNVDTSGHVDHIVTADTVDNDVVNEFFPPSSHCDIGTSSNKGTKYRKWRCQREGCGKLIRGQERIAHVLEHRGQKRYKCTCGSSFVRSQDQRRHLREQAPCSHCSRPVGRRSANGTCRTCCEELADEDFSHDGT